MDKDTQLNQEPGRKKDCKIRGKDIWGNYI